MGDRAIEQFRAVLQMEPNFSHAHMVELAYVQKGEYTEAFDDMREWQQTEIRPWTWGMEAYIYGKSGDQVKARRALNRLEELSKQEAIDPEVFAYAYLGMNEKDQALSCLEEAYLLRSNTVVALSVDPVFDPLRGDGRFQALLQRVGFVQ